MLPSTRELLQKLLSIIRQNTMISFLGPLFILPAASGLLVTMGYSFPSPWLVVMASLPGLAVMIVNAVRMGRQLVAVSKKSSASSKEGEL